jgi:hypothetical protein
VHDLVHILLLRVHVSVEVDDPDLAVHELRHTASAGIAEIWSWAFGDVGRTEDVPHITHLERLAKIDRILAAVFW